MLFAGGTLLRLGGRKVLANLLLYGIVFWMCTNLSLNYRGRKSIVRTQPKKKATNRKHFLVTTVTWLPCRENHGIYRNAGI